jgi:hypothetical protein
MPIRPGRRITVFMLFSTERLLSYKNIICETN